MAERFLYTQKARRGFETQKAKRGFGQKKLKKGDSTQKKTERGDLDREQNSIEENNAIYDQYE